MALLQVLAASMTGLDRLAFHVGDRSGQGPLAEARRLLADQAGRRGPLPTPELIRAIQAMGFTWGVSNRT